jgi:hypothetical protein
MGNWAIEQLSNVHPPLSTSLLSVFFFYLVGYIGRVCQLRTSALDPLQHEMILYMSSWTLTLRELCVT